MNNPVSVDNHVSFKPDWSLHPGRLLAEHLAARQWSQAELSRQSGLSRKLVSTIINGHNPVTPDTARRLEATLGLKADIWLGIQARHDLARSGNAGETAGQTHHDRMVVELFALVTDLAPPDLETVLATARKLSRS